MKKAEKIGTAFILAFGLTIAAPLLSAQNHGEVGAFAELFRLQTVTPTINFVGVGGRAAVNIHQHVQFEAEMSYDFRRNFTTTFSNGLTTTFVPSRLRTLTALFGPKFQTGGGALRAFVTLKGGFLNFDVSRASIPTGFTTAIGNVLTGDTNGVFYPGGGIELFAGPIGFRVEVGDEMYFDNGANNNLRVTVGPQFRF
jgi:hypothetical protein